MSTFMRVCLHPHMDLSHSQSHTRQTDVLAPIYDTQTPAQHTECRHTSHHRVQQGAGKKVLRHPPTQQQHTPTETERQMTDRRMKPHTNYASARTQTHTPVETLLPTQRERKMDKSSLYHHKTRALRHTDREALQKASHNVQHTHTHTQPQTQRKTDRHSGRSDRHAPID